jgi:hypothetical protein
MNAYTFQLASTLCAAILCLTASAHETEVKIPAPGFRPESPNASEFLKTIKTATVTVYPSIVRTPRETSFSDASQKQVVDYLKKNKMAKSIKSGKKADPGKLEGHSQWEMFQNDMKAIAQKIKKQKSVYDYILVMEFLIPPRRNGATEIFGIHCFILDKNGENAFSFLLNSHHKPFVDAQLRTEGSSEKERNALVEKSTRVALDALVQQMQDAEKPAS